MTRCVTNLTGAFLKRASSRAQSGSSNSPTRFLKVKLRRRFNGSNNGRISLSLAEGARILRASKSSIQTALVELEEHGFIRLIKKGYFTGRMASEFALTDEQLDGHPPTREWRQWQPTNPHRRRQIRAIGIQTTLDDMRKE